MGIPEKRALVLLSGGLDSATALAVTMTKFDEVFALTFKYGQRHEVEIEAARKIAGVFGVTGHKFLHLNLREIGGSALTDDIEVPVNRSDVEIAGGIPITYVPARNAIFLTVAMGYAEVNHIANIVIGVNSLDYSGYPDCRPEFIDAFQAMANLALKATVEREFKIKIEAPLIHLKKSEIIRTGNELGVDFSICISCYDPGENGEACGECDSCILRRKGFEEAGIADPTIYRQPVK